MKICMIAANNTKYSPYIGFYTEILDASHIDYDILVPQRSDALEFGNPRVHVLPWEVHNWKGKDHKELSYFEYTRAAWKIIHRKKYDRLIVLTSNIAVFLSLHLSMLFSVK